MKKSLLLLSLAALSLAFSCQDGFLDERPDKALLVPSTLADFQALLDNYNRLNRTAPLPEVASGDFIVPDAELRSRIKTLQNAYVWAADVYEGEDAFAAIDWTELHAQMLRPNIVLDGLENLDRTPSNQAEYDRVQGSALFFRSYLSYSIAQVYASAFDPATADRDQGLPLRLSSDVTALTGRSTVRETYAQIIGDAEKALSLLPAEVPFPTRPSQPAARAFLARMFLSMGDYPAAERYADEALQDRGQLLDYNTLDLTRNFPRALATEHPEIIFYSVFLNFGLLESSSAIIHPDLYGSYAAEDLRRRMFFVDRGSGRINFKGSYDGTPAPFSGLATDELYLIRAECRARRGDTDGAMEDLNFLLAHRWKAGTFTPFEAATAEEALRLVLRERRKELVFRGLRWSDLRRLNREPAFATTLTRTVDGVTHTLPPNSPRYVFPIPQTELDRNPMPQNPR